MKNKKFDIILFLGRPAAGKSEVIDFLKKQKLKERKKIFHIGKIAEIDDFKFLWELGEKDDKREERGLPRKYTKKVKVGGYVLKERDAYKILIKKINQYFKKNFFNEEFFKNHTLFIEFSRGGRNGYKTSLELLDKNILKRAVIYYINVSYEEAVRKNKRRYDPSQPDSILFHTVPDEVMRRYKTDDWKKLTSKNPEFIEIKKIKIPYAVFENEPEKTDDPDKIRKELLRTIDKLFINYTKLKS